MPGMVCEKRMLIMLKAPSAYYKIVIRPVLKYGSKTWPLRKAVQKLLEKRCMMGIKRIEKIRID